MDVRVGTGHYDAEKRVPQFDGLAERKGYNQEAARIEKVRYSHEAMIDMIVADPRITQNKLAEVFGYSVGWVSRVIGSDAFQAALAERRKEIADPFLIATMEDRMRGLAMQSVDVLVRKLETTQDASIAMKALDITAKALGFGVRDRSPANVQNNFVVQMPEKATTENWIKEYGSKSPEPRGINSTIDHNPLVQPEPMKIAEETEK